MSVKNPGDSINIELRQFEIIYNKLIEICKNYKKNISKYFFFQDKFTAIAEFYNINAEYMIPIEPTINDIKTYTISNTFIKIFLMIEKIFSDGLIKIILF